MKRLRAVIVKEFAHILRDPASLSIIFLMPLLMMFVFGYSINYDLNSIETGLIDYDGGEAAGELGRSFANNHYFKVRNLRKEFPNESAPEVGERLLKQGALKMVIIIPRDFSKNLKLGRKSDVGIIIDGSDSNVANLVHQYNEMVIFNFVTELKGIDELIKIKTKIYFNPEVKSAFFFIPGLVAILLVMISAILTSLSVSREKESGSIDLIFISPLKSSEIIIGKTIPYVFVAFAVGAMTLLFARFWFGVPIRGNLFALLVLSLIYMVAGLAMGILISTVAPSQQAAMFMALLSTMLPSIMLSGFIFPIDAMPKPLQVISHIVPARYYLKIIRGMAVKGAGLEHFIKEAGALVIFAAVLMTAATIKFSRNRKRAK